MFHIFNRQQRENNNILLYLFAGFVGWTTFSIDDVKAAAFKSPEEQLILEQTRDSNIDDSLGFNINDFYNQPYQQIELVNEGLEKIEKGDTGQGLREIQNAWSLNPNNINVGVILCVKLIQSKDYELALSVAKQIQNTKNSEQFGIGYTLEGMIYAATEELDKAAAAFREAIKILPNEKNALQNLATLAEARKNYSEAKTYLQKILDLEPTQLKALESLARIEYISGNTGKATELLNKAIAEHPEAVSPLITLARYQLKSGQYEDVLKLTEQKNNPTLLELRGKAYFYLGETEQAEQVFLKIIEQLPDSAPANYILADFFFKTRDFSEAAKQIQNTIIKDANYLPARIGEIKILYLTGKVLEANKESESLLEEFGNRQEVLSIAGWLSMQQQDYVQAAKYFEQVADIKPNTEIILWWVNSLWAQKQYDEGFSILHDWITHNPDDISVQLAIADGYMGLQKFPEAKKKYLEVIKKAPNIAGAYNNLAWIEQEENLQQAIKYARRAVEISNQSPQTLDTLAMLLVKDGQIDQSGELLKQAVNKAPNNSELLYHLAEVFVVQNKNDEAMKIIDKLVTLDLSEDMNNRLKILQNKVNKK